MRTIRKYYRVDRRRINMLRFVFEAYEGIAVVTTLDPAQGLIVLAIAPGCEQIVQDVMVDLGRRFMLEPYDGPPLTGPENIYR